MERRSSPATGSVEELKRMPSSPLARVYDISRNKCHVVEVETCRDYENIKKDITNILSFCKYMRCEGSLLRDYLLLLGAFSLLIEKRCAARNDLVILCIVNQ